MNTTELISITKDKLASKTKIRAFMPGSIARSMLETYNEVAVEIHSALNVDIVNSLISSSYGSRLDEIGILVGEPRKLSNYAIGYVTISIDPLSGKTLSDLIAILETATGSSYTSITIPMQTEVSNDDGTKTYNLTTSVDISDTPVNVDVLSYNVGSGGNADSGVIKRFTSLSTDLTPILSYLIVTNPVPIDSGQEDETDENYRYRIINRFNTAVKANDMAIRLAALSVPGVANVYLRNYEYGIGSTGLFIVSESPIVSQGILNAVQAAVNSVKSASEIVVVSSPTYKAIKMQIRLQFTPDTHVGDKDIIVDQTTTNVINYVNNLGLGKEVVMTEVDRIVKDTSTKIYDFSMDQVGVGDYNFQSGLIEYYEPTLPVNQICDITEKFVTNTKLITVCY